jgi:hypothetical protein
MSIGSVKETASAYLNLTLKAQLTLEKCFLVLHSVTVSNRSDTKTKGNQNTSEGRKILTCLYVKYVGAMRSTRRNRALCHGYGLISTLHMDRFLSKLLLCAYLR